MATKKKNNFASHQAEVVAGHVQLIQAELKDIRDKAGLAFEDLDSLVRHLSKLTGLHRTTLKRNTSYRTVLREFLARQAGPPSLGTLEGATPEVLRAMVVDRDQTIENLNRQINGLKARLTALGQNRHQPNQNLDEQAATAVLDFVALRNNVLKTPCRAKF